MNNTLPHIYLKQGEYFISNGEAVEVSTVLGSCVSVTFHSPSHKIGAITHALMPSHKDIYRQNQIVEGRFVDSSIECVSRKLLLLGIDMREVEIKVFGGAQMYGNKNGTQNQTLNMGRKNVESALMTLQRLGLRIRVSEVGGQQGRKVLFYPQKGDVWIKRIVRNLHQSEVSHD